MIVEINEDKWTALGLKFRNDGHSYSFMFERPFEVKVNVVNGGLFLSERSTQHSDLLALLSRDVETPDQKAAAIQAEIDVHSAQIKTLETKKSDVLSGKIEVAEVNVLRG